MWVSGYLKGFRVFEALETPKLELTVWGLGFRVSGLGFRV